jgi:hypothetical protein
MTKFLGTDAYKAARDQTTKKLQPMKEAMISVINERDQCQHAEIDPWIHPMDENGKARKGRITKVFIKELKMKQYFEKQLANPLYISPMWKVTLIDDVPKDVNTVLTTEDILKQTAKQLQYNAKGQRLVYFILDYDDIEVDKTYSENRREVDRLDDMIESYERFGLSIAFKKYASDGETPIFELKNKEKECT